MIGTEDGQSLTVKVSGLPLPVSEAEASTEAIPVDFRRIRTDFVRRKLRETPWEDRQYIDALMLLEDAIVDGITGFAHGMWWHQMKKAYEFEIAAIKRELALGRPLTDKDLDEITAELKREKDQQHWKRRQEIREDQEEEERMKEIEMESWREMGGKVETSGEG
ncbi:MAG: hypothetical protein ACM3X4_01255 [Ignavibacteriales bacterium]